VQLLRTKIPKAHKDIDDLTVFFALLGSAQVKASCKILMKSTTGVNFTNILQEPFCTKVFCKAFF